MVRRFIQWPNPTRASPRLMPVLAFQAASGKRVGLEAIEFYRFRADFTAAESTLLNPLQCRLTG